MWLQECKKKLAEGDVNTIATVSSVHSCAQANVKTKWLTNPPRESKDNNFLLYMLYYSSFFSFRKM